MDRDTLVYVDLQGTPFPVGRLWSRVRKDRESATFEYDQGWLTHLRQMLPGVGTGRRVRRVATSILTPFR